MRIEDALVQSVQPEGRQGMRPQVVVKDKIKVSGRSGSSVLKCSEIQIAKNPRLFLNPSRQTM
jgi:hypothetical protein